MSNMKIGKILKKLRIDKGVSQEVLAKLLNVSRQAYCRYENDQRELPLDALCTLADFYDETTDALLGREPV